MFEVSQETHHHDIEVKDAGGRNAREDARRVAHVPVRREGRAGQDFARGEREAREAGDDGVGMDLLQVVNGGASPEQSQVLEVGETVGHASDVWLVDWLVCRVLKEAYDVERVYTTVRCLALIF